MAYIAVGRAQLCQDYVAQPLNRFRRDLTIARRQLAFYQRDLSLEVGTPATLGGKARREVGITRADDLLLDEIKHVLDGPLDPGALGAQRLYLRLTFADGGGAVVEQVREQLAQPFRAQQPLSERIDHDRLERLIAHAGAGARRLPATQPARAAVIAILATLAGGYGQRMATFGMAALGDAREHRRAGDERRRGDLPSIAGNASLDFEPFGFWDDDRCRDFLPLLLGTLHAIPGVVDAVEVPAAISRAGEDVADVRDVPLAPPQRSTRSVEVADDLLVSHPSLAGTDPLHPEDLLNHQRLGRLDHQPLLRLGAAHLGNLGRVAKWGHGTIPEPGFGIALHGVAGELGGLSALILVEVGKDRTDEIALRILPDILSDRDDGHPGALQLPAVVLEQVVVAEQA